jgi:hypothetical protein
MIPPTSLDEETLENDVRYGIADCRRRLRNRRITLRTLHHPLQDVTNGVNSSEAHAIESYAELLATVSMSQSSLAKLVECLLGPPESKPIGAEGSAEREEAVRT